MDQELADASACVGQTLRAHSPDSSTFLHDVIPAVNNPAKFHPGPICYDGALGFF